MEHFFDRVPYGGVPEFSIYTLTHLIVILSCIFLIYLFYKISPKLRDFKYEKYVRYTIATFMLLSSISIFTFAYENNFMWYKYLPEATCGWAIYFGGLALFTKNRTLAILTFFWGWGAISTLLLPNILDGPTRYNFYQFFLRHILILVSAIYLLRVLDFKIYKSDFKIYLSFTLSLAILSGVLAHIINDPSETNMFYMLQPAKNTPLFGPLNDYNHFLYLVVWLISGSLIGYIYALPFYQKSK